MAPKGRRGVLMTASAKPKRQVAEVDSDDGEAKENVEKSREASQKEWEELEREAKQTVRSRLAADAFAQGQRDTVTASYDDVAEEGNADGEESKLKSPSGGAASPDAAASTAATAKEDSEDEEDEKSEDEVRPEGVVTAGKVSREPGERKRAGKKKTGSQKKREKAEKADKDAAGAAEGSAGKKRKRTEEEEEDRWVKLKLVGDQKPKRIDATRVVSYYDFDAKGNPYQRPLFSSSSSRPMGTEGPELDDDDEEGPVPRVQLAPPAPAGNFRAMLRADLWADDSEDD
eukprot:gb/GFBE01009480.1/.p1 GENE.gb/GFBE01009480.1/~~gb/GFBE01009480.1/.p1  ORF type:complete len:287 (+),score=86.22 gb/GFBE01009480.1/:1-861(+)